jgi:hypothetical protein
VGQTHTVSVHLSALPLLSKEIALHSLCICQTLGTHSKPDKPLMALGSEQPPVANRDVIGSCLAWNVVCPAALI